MTTLARYPYSSGVAEDNHILPLAPAIAKSYGIACRGASRGKADVLGARIAVDDAFRQWFYFTGRRVCGRADFSFDSVEGRRQKHRAMLGVLRHRLRLDSMKLGLDLPRCGVQTVRGQLSGQVWDGDSR